MTTLRRTLAIGARFGEGLSSTRLGHSGRSLATAANGMDRLLSPLR
jgi:hypothetical protein